MDDGTVSWRELYFETAERLGSEAEAKWLCMEASGSEALDWVGGLDDPAGARAVARLDAMVARRLTGEPVQYVLGSWSFRQVELMVDRRVLIPRPETEQVVEWALERLRALQPPLTVVELGVGSGAIALSVAAERPGTEVWAADRSTEALAVARANLAALGMAGARVRMVEGDWCAALPAELAGGIDLLISNPPYVAADEELPASVVDWEPVEALVPGPTGLEAYRILVDQAPRWLAPGGALVVEIGASQAAAVAALAADAGFVDVRVAPDLAGLDRAVVARRAS